MIETISDSDRAETMVKLFRYYDECYTHGAILESRSVKQGMRIEAMEQEIKQLKEENDKLKNEVEYLRADVER